MKYNKFEDIYPEGSSGMRARELELSLGKNKLVHKLIIRFYRKVDKKSDSECWNWIGSKSKNGYGMFSVWGSKMKAHRVSFIIHENVFIPGGMYVCHSCDNKACVNPYHLWIGTNHDNQMDSVKKGRNYMPIGELAPSCKLKEEQVLDIRRMHSEGMCQRRIADKFPVGYKAINKIVLRQRWKHI